VVSARVFGAQDVGDYAGGSAGRAGVRGGGGLRGKVVCHSGKCEHTLMSTNFETCKVVWHSGKCERTLMNANLKRVKWYGTVQV